MSAKRAYEKERDAVLRSLDERRLDQFYRKWNLRRPSNWIGDARLRLMHKCRLRLSGFSEAEKSVSRVWLSEHRSDEEIGTSDPCPACGGVGISHSDCEVCGARNLQ